GESLLDDRVEVDVGKSRSELIRLVARRDLYRRRHRQRGLHVGGIVLEEVVLCREIGVSQAEGVPQRRFRPALNVENRKIDIDLEAIEEAVLKDEIGPVLPKIWSGVLGENRVLVEILEMPFLLRRDLRVVGDKGLLREDGSSDSGQEKHRQIQAHAHRENPER